MSAGPSDEQNGAVSGSPLPPNLKTLHAEEERIRERSLKTIESTGDLSDHLAVVHSSLDLLYAYTKLHRDRDDDELTLPLLGIRLFNATVSAFRLGTAGYYQTAISIIRDIVETGFLLDYFSIDRTKIKEWRESTREQRLKNFRPRDIRDALAKRDGEKSRRGEVYEALCEMATHPTYVGSKLIAPNTFAQIGPFFDAELLRLLINELALRLPHHVLLFSSMFPSKNPLLLLQRQKHLDEIRAWYGKYFPGALPLTDSG